MPNGTFMTNKNFTFSEFMDVYEFMRGVPPKKVSLMSPNGALNVFRIIVIIQFLL